MGLFDFFNKKNVKPADPQPERTQPSKSSEPKYGSQPNPAPKPPSAHQEETLSKEERYGKASLAGYKTGKWGDAIIEFKKLENEGFGEASIALGQLAQVFDKAKGLTHFRKAAAAGLAEGAWGCASIIGHDYIADITGEDEEWYDYCLKSAQGGCADAMNELANMYNRINDFLGAFYWYQMAAYYEHPHGYYSVMGIINKWIAAGKPALSGIIDGVRPNDVKNAVSIFRCLAQVDSIDPHRIDQFMHSVMEDDNEIMGLFLGHFFEDSVRMDGNARLAYQLAAHNNSIMGMKCLADMQAAGRGCERDMQKAFEWYLGAAEAGEKNACFIIGEFYRQQNKNLAAYWYSAALRRGYEPAYTRLQQL